MIDLDTLTARDLCRSLMCGDRMEMRRGYSAESAALTAAEFKKIDDEEEVRDLLRFARGLADGLADAIEATDPATKFERCGPTNADAVSDAYGDGRYAGMGEPGFLLYPTLTLSK